MKVTFLTIFLCLTIYQCVDGQDRCGCGGVRHPQVRYCDSDFAMMIEIHDKVESDYPFAEPDPFDRREYARFNISVLQVFKPKEMEADLVTEDYTELWTSIENFCGKPELELLQNYVISGDFDYVTDPETGEEYQLLTITRCHLSIKLDDLSDYQMQGLTGEYDRFCDDGCQPNVVVGKEVHTEIGAIDTQFVPIEALTQYWTLDQECFYNPAASLHNLADDCEGMYSVCQRNELTHQCTWDINSQFRKCYRERGMAVSFRQNPNAAAITKPSDCKYLTNKRLKKKCLRKLKKVYKQQLNNERHS